MSHPAPFVRLRDDGARWIVEADDCKADSGGIASSTTSRMGISVSSVMDELQSRQEQFRRRRR